MIGFGKGKKQKGSGMNAVLDIHWPEGRRALGENLLRANHPVKVLSIVVIVLLSVGLWLFSFERRTPEGLLSQPLYESEGQAFYGFVLLMLLTVGYLIGKGWSARHDQQKLMAELLDKEATTRSRRIDPFLEFHHPELCREILVRQANSATRMKTALALVQMTVPGFGQLSTQEHGRAIAESFYFEVRRHRRALDIWLRWSPDVFLLILLVPAGEEVASVVHRLRLRLSAWWEEQNEVPKPPPIEWRYRTLRGLGNSGDVLEEVGALMDPGQFAASSVAGVWQAKEEPQGVSEPRLSGKGSLIQ